MMVLSAICCLPYTPGTVLLMAAVPVARVSGALDLFGTTCASTPCSHSSCISILGPERIVAGISILRSSGSWKYTPKAAQVTSTVLNDYTLLWIDRWRFGIQDDGTVLNARE